jgi:hypothetical protein
VPVHRTNRVVADPSLLSPRFALSAHLVSFSACRLDIAPSPQSKSAGKRDAQFERPGLSQEEIAELKEAFNLFDQDGSGTIDPSELRSAMTSLGYDVKNPLVFQILSNLDKSGKGAIDFEEFLDMMTARMVRLAIHFLFFFCVLIWQL